MDDKCSVCHGTGYCGPYNAPDTPSILRTIGCWPCNTCGGTGKKRELILTAPAASEEEG